MGFKDIGGTLVDIGEIVAVQAVYGAGIELTMRGGGMVKLNGASKVDGKPVMEFLTQALLKA